MANWTLELTMPKPSGAVGTGLPAGHKVLTAYPGVPYRYFAAARGGDPPYVFSMSGQPSGMTIDSDTGEVTWSNPTTGTHTGITVTVTDESDNTDSETYSLSVTTTGFRFIDGTNGSDANDGVLVAAGGSGPWATIDRLYDDTNNVIAYFRTGTYTFAGVPVVNAESTYDKRCFFQSGDNRCTRWLAYPGETVTLDFESDHTDPGGSVPSLRLNSDYSYVDGFTFLDGFNKFLWMDRGDGRGLTVINCHFVNLGPGASGSNSACIMFTHAPGANQTQNDVVVNNTVENIGYTDDQTCFIKMYDTLKSYVAFNTGDTDLNSSETIAYKDACSQFMNYRNNIAADVTALGGNNHNSGAFAEGTSGEVWYSRYKGTTWALAFNQDSQAEALYWERCTFEGSIHGRNVDELDGPFTFRNCVIINGDGAQTPWPYIWDEFNAATSTNSGGSGVQDSSRVVVPTSATPTGNQNLAGNAAAGIVDANGLLQGTYRTNYLGGWGHEIVGGGGGVLRTPGVVVLDFTGTVPVLSVGGGEPAVNDARLIFRAVGA